MTQEVVGEHEKRKGHATFYALLIFVAVGWIWNVKVHGFGANAAEAVGFDIGSLALPLLLLWFAAKKFIECKSHSERASARKLAVALITAACALMACIDVFNPDAPHRVGAFIFVILFGTISGVLFKWARRISINNAPEDFTLQI